eukprot:CAMPEP_0198711718 /NCGR_PEP_ID=MMETSP1471-20131121/3742_1 /TAXON_ID=41880 /ORGANISM="Pycnococcus provasolii, Strain RCC733" /LENGTH=120 /DNA_ID=CAMNT_0044471583 /DNA_START=37 /DNA_END=396 /DNA_ORIENTATION=-
METATTSTPLLLPTTCRSSCTIHNTDTELLVSLFADRVLALASQTGKLGTITQASAIMSPFDGARNTAVSTLLGRRDDLVSGAITRVVSERLQRAGDERPVVACVSLTKQAGAVEAKAVA